MALYVRDNVATTILHSHADPEGRPESIWCRTRLSPNGYIILRVVYRTPGAEASSLIDELFLYAREAHSLILGDFNVPHINWLAGCVETGADRFTHTLFQSIEELSLHQHVHQPTRCVHQQRSTLDLVISPRRSDVARIEHLPPLGSSDHSVLVIHWVRGVQRPGAKPLG